MGKYIYLIQREDENSYKIGNSKNVKSRLKMLQTANDKKLYIIHEFYSEFPTKLEIMLHNVYKRYQKSGEWFHLDQIHVDTFLEECKKNEELLKFLKNENPFFEKI